VSFAVDVTPLEASLLHDSNSAGDSFVGGFLAKLCKITKEEELADFDNLIFT
jgi:sugar/nucleoside kinase (ribokinase family)